jgi:hypothetical protein
MAGSCAVVMRALNKSIRVRKVVRIAVFFSAKVPYFPLFVNSLPPFAIIFTRFVIQNGYFVSASRHFIKMLLKKCGASCDCDYFCNKRK